MKTVIVDLAGALIDEKPFKEAHKEWFKLFGHLLNDPEIITYSQISQDEEYFSKVNEVMERYLGNVGDDDKNRFARWIFAMTILAKINKENVKNNFADYLRTIKPDVKLVLITSSPVALVEPLLEKLGCKDIFDEVYSSPMDHQPDKKDILNAYIENNPLPDIYIGKGDSFLKYCKDAGMFTVSVGWFNSVEIEGNIDVVTVKELTEQLKVQ